MKSVRNLGLLTLGSWALTLACTSTDQGSAKSRQRRPRVTVTTRPSQAGVASTSSERATQPPVARKAMTASDNPTSQAGRGEPSLDDVLRPAAWVYIDGHQGKLTEQGGRPLVHGFVEEPVKSAPTFRVEAYSPLLGEPKDFSCVLSTVESADGSHINYAIQAEKGTFQAGREYALLRPGADFTIRNRTTGDVVSEIAPLVPGTYLIAAAVKNLQTDHEGLAITYFTVADGP